MESGFGSASWPLRDEHVRLLQVNWLDPLFGARLATLPARANPSSRHVLMPFTGTLLGRQGGFGRHWTFNNGSLSSEAGLANNLYVKLAGDPVLKQVSFGNEDLESGAAVARFLTAVFNAHATIGTGATGRVWTWTYSETTLAFTAASTIGNFGLYRYTVANGGALDDAGLDVLGFIEAESSVEAASITGHKTIGTEEWIVWDVGECGMLGREASGVADGGRQTADWFCLRDLNFDRVPAAACTGLEEDSGWAVSRGRPKLVLMASNTLVDLEDWCNASWTEGVNQFTFVDDSVAVASGPLRNALTGDQVYGTDGRLWLQRQRETSWDSTLDRTQEFGGVFPARHITANLRAWAAAEGQSGPPFVGPYPTGLARPGYRYWMLLMVNPGNLSGRLLLGAHALASGFYFGRNIVDGSGRTVSDRGVLVETEMGAMVGRPGMPRRECRLSFEFVPEGDVYLFEQTTLRLRENATAAGSRHGGVMAPRRAGRHRPFFVVDPFPDPAGEVEYEDADDQFSVASDATTGYQLTITFNIEGTKLVDMRGFSAPNLTAFVTLIWAAFNAQVPPSVMFAMGYDSGTGLIYVTADEQIWIEVTGWPLTAWPRLGFPVDEDNGGPAGYCYSEASSEWIDLEHERVARIAGLRSTRWARGTMLGSPEFEPSAHQFLDVYHQSLRIVEWSEER